MAVINAGDLRHLVNIHQPIESRNDEGGKETDYALFGSAWAMVKEVNRFKTVDAGTPAEVSEKDFFIRYAQSREQIKKDFRVQYNAELYYVSEVERVEEDKRFIRIRGARKSG